MYSHHSLFMITGMLHNPRRFNWVCSEWFADGFSALFQTSREEKQLNTELSYLYSKKCLESVRVKEWFPKLSHLKL
jgi:hypothetical protein